MYPGPTEADDEKVAFFLFEGFGENCDALGAGFGFGVCFGFGADCDGLVPEVVLVLVPLEAPPP